MDDDDDVDGGNVNSGLWLFACSQNGPNVNYKFSTSKIMGEKNTNTKDKLRQLVYILDNTKVQHINHYAVRKNIYVYT
jgi:hypothetical protein